MSALSQNLHQSIHRALNIARDYRQGEATPEHLLFALTDDPEATPVLLASNVDLAKLRGDLLTSLSGASANVRSSIEKPRPNTALQSVIHRAVRHAHSVNQHTVTAAHALVSIFSDPVAQFLQDHGMTRYDAVCYLCHGIVKPSRTATLAKSRTVIKASTPLEDKTSGSTYDVVLLNDEYTTMAFVVSVLQEALHVSCDEAMRITLLAERNGSASCGYYSRAEAENLARGVMDRAREAQHPLRCLVRPADRRHDLVSTIARVAIMVVPREYLPNWFERALR